MYLKKFFQLWLALFLQCFKMAEQYEDDIEEWYFEHQDEDLMTYLCANRALRKDDKSKFCF